MLQKVSLFSSRREFFIFLLACVFILIYSLLIEFQNYKKLTRFESNLVNAIIVNQYSKTKNQKTYQVLKLKSEDGFTFYSTAKNSFPNSIGKKVELEIWVKKVNFYQYMTSFYAYSKIRNVEKEESLKQKLNAYLLSKHENRKIANIYQGLYTAALLSRDLYSSFSALGISHLLAISGFHLGVLSALLFFLLKYPYKILQNRYFPYRNYKSDIFIIISIVLFLYLLFLDYPPSLLRSFTMLIIGFMLYDRAIKIISMQTLLISVLLLLSFFPRLVFALGFWLSVSGVFYIFLFLIYFKHLNKIWQFTLVPFWVYILMLPFSLAIFGTFSIYHPLSIIWTTLFTIFYPLSIFLHLVGYGNLFDGVLESFIDLGNNGVILVFKFKWLALHLILSFLSLWKKSFVWLLLFYSLSVSIYAVYHVT
jgi:competence protein ComEC